jgi:hypothetical protein
MVTVLFLLIRPAGAGSLKLVDLNKENYQATTTSRW